MENQIQNTIIFTIIISTIVVLLLISVIILFFVIHQRKMFNSKLQLEKQTAEHKLEMLSNMNRAQEKERLRIANTIHDQVGALFFSAKMHAGELAQRTKDAEVQEQVNDIQELIILGMDEMRKSIQALSPTLIEKHGFVKAVGEFIRIIGQNSSVKFEIEFKGDYKKLNDEAEISLYRVIQECINNSLKHSKCSNIKLKFNQLVSKLSIEISDNGKGFDVLEKKKSNGLGLKNIESRILLLGGKFDLDSAHEKGTKYIFEIPMNINL